MLHSASAWRRSAVVEATSESITFRVGALQFQSQAEVDGGLTLLMGGQGGADTVTAAITPATDSTGSVSATVLGGSGDDTLALHLSNPGLASMQAAAHPAHVDYLYYARKSDKKHHFFTASYGAFQQFLAKNGYG